MSSTRSRSALAFLILLAMALALPAADLEWPGFRGVNAAGVSSSTGLPTEFGPEKNLVWEVEVPFGRSSPAISKDRIYLTAVDGNDLVTLAVDRKSGKELWRWTVERVEKAEFHTATDSATPSPVTDGENVYAFFHEAGLVSYDANGKERWRVPLGPFRNFYGMAASPVLAGERLFVLCDQAEGSFLLAVDKNTGKELWRQERPARLEAYTTPILYPDADAPKALLVSGSRWVDAYDPATGEILWTKSGVASGPISTPVLMGDTLYVSGIDHAEDGWAPFGPLLEQHDKDGDGELSRKDVEGAWIANHFGWLNSDGKANITIEDWQRVEREMVNEHWGVYAIRVGDGSAETVWNYRKNVPYIPSPLVHDDVFYMIKDDIITSLDPKTGEVLKRGRLGESKSKVYASPIAADGKIYIGTLDGDVAVLRAGAEWSVLASNTLGDEIWASPAIADGHLYVRTKGKLYAFAAKAEPEAKEEQGSRQTSWEGTP
ncbi:MAG: PQQ-like beta-propeller repeat protein [bacterium]|nr:PQQ-like beta-propeller repeat protein [bacterium]